MSWTDAEVYSHPAMDHVITGKRAQNRGPYTLRIRDAIIKDQGIMTGISKHVRQCEECDPDKILWGFLNKQMKKGGMTSLTMWNFVQIMGRAGKVKADTYQNFVLRTGRVDLFKPWMGNLSAKNRIHGSALCVANNQTRDPVITAYAGLLPYVEYPEEELQAMVAMMVVHTL